MIQAAEALSAVPALVYGEQIQRNIFTVLSRSPTTIKQILQQKNISTVLLRLLRADLRHYQSQKMIL